MSSRIICCYSKLGLVFLCLLFPGVLSFRQAPLIPNKIRSGRGTSIGAEPMAMTMDTMDLSLEQKRRSLVGDFLVEMEITGDNGVHSWSLIPVEEVVSPSNNPEDNLSPGAKSWKALHIGGSPGQSASPIMSLSSQIKGNSIELQITSTQPAILTEHAKLLSVMARVLAQYTVNCATKDSKQNQSVWDLVILSELEREEIGGVNLSIEGIPELFDSDSAIEIVDMVSREGGVIGMVPRSLVHSLNILHRGIGLTVSKDDSFSELYVHRRTDFKRIFPSLYDMFVGGVSLSGEDARLTAKREVAEELGLSRALDQDSSSSTNQQQQALSDPLFKCVVCTSYNRCVVTVFQYTMDPLSETISWQEEEVSWGDFVPYDTVEAAADLSIQRLVEKKEWPGMYPAFQSKWKGKQPLETPACSTAVDDWTTWDFVPDGLLVWEAWLKWRRALL